jgi:hypothetical protein
LREFEKEVVLDLALRREMLTVTEGLIELGSHYVDLHNF